MNNETEYYVASTEKLDSESLYHYGRLGMKWGQHIFTKMKDYSNTRRQKREVKKAAAKQKKINSSPKKKAIKEMSAEELNSRIERLRLEKTYRDLLKETRPETTGKGKQFVMNILSKSVDNIGTQAATYAFGTAVNAMVKKATGTSENIVNPKKGQKDK